MNTTILKVLLTAVMSKIPHPFVVESMQILKNLPVGERNRVRFIRTDESHQSFTGPE